MNKKIVRNVTLISSIISLSLILSCGGGGGGGGGNGGPSTPEGTALNTVQLTLGSPRSGHVDTTVSYYSVPVTTSIDYTVTLTNLTDDADLVVYRDNWTTVGCVSIHTGTASESCHTTSSGTTLYIQVSGAATAAGATYTITAAQTPTPTPTGVVAIAGDTQNVISWSTVTGTSYNIYYSETNGAGTGGTKIPGVTTPYTHGSLTNGVTYYYVITAVKSGLESVASNQVSATPTAPLPLPQTFNFDGGTLQGWSATGTWGLTTSLTYSSSTYAITDSPAGSYSNSTNTSITSPVLDLTGAGSRSLSFYHRYSIESSFDKGYVEVSTDGGATFTNITPVVPDYYYSGSVSAFENVTIDLSTYKTNAVVIRFRLVTDWITTFDGWYIDQIVIQ